MEAELDSTLGAIYVGVTITGCLYGIFTLHGYTYWNRQKQDSTFIRISMAVLWLADTVKLVCATHVGYRLLITEYENDPAALYYGTWSINTELLLTALILFAAQILTAYHAWKSAKQIHVFWATPRVIRSLGIIAGLFAFLQLSFGVTVSSLCWIYPDVRDMDKYRWVASVWLGSAAFGSVIITYMLSALLVSTYVSAQGTIDIINEFLRCIIHTGGLASIFTVANLLVFSFMGQYIRIAVSFPLGTLNLITLLAILNTRPHETSEDCIIVQGYECGATEHEDRLHKDMTSLEVPLRIGKLALKIPSKVHKKTRSIKVFVQKDTHVISIPRVDVNYSRFVVKHQADSYGTKSTGNQGDFAKLQTSPT